MKRFTKLALIGATTSLAAAPGPAQQAEPALQFAAKLILGETAQAQSLILEPVTQATQMPLVDGKDILTASEFSAAIAGCELMKVTNDGATTYANFSADLTIVWTCERGGIRARVKSIANSVDVSRVQKVLFVPPMPPVSKGGNH